MLNENFLNNCFTLLLSKSNRKEDKATYRDIIEILDFYKSKENLDVPITVQNKFNCLRKISELKLLGKTNDNVIESVSEGKFKELYDFLISKSEEELNEENIKTFMDQIRTKKKLRYVFNSYDELNNFVDLLKSNSFESIEDLVFNYETYIKNAFVDLSKIERDNNIESTSALDLMNDNYNSVLATIVNKYQSVQKIPSGYSQLDQEALNGGFESSRIYIFAGATGSGKSTLLNNIIVNNVLSRGMDNQTDDLNEHQIFVYITLENTLDEAFLRTYQPMFNISTEDVINQIESNSNNINQQLKEKMNSSNVNIVMKYYSPNSISCLDIRALLDEIKDANPESKITGLCIDYLELLNSDIKYDLYRIELGSIVLSAKSIAVDYEIPVLMPTQLNRSVYRIQETSELNMDQMGESIKKAENSDFCSLQVRDPMQEDLVQFKVVKNRAGKANVSFNFKVNWDKYKFSRCYTLSNSNKVEVNDFDTEKFGDIKTPKVNAF